MPRSSSISSVKEFRHLKFWQLRHLADEELMIHLQNGDDDALAVLFDRYHSLVLAVARRIVRDAGEAEDVMQTVFYEIYRAVAQFSPSKGTTKGWILQYAYHRSMNRRRQLTSRGFYNQAGMDDFHENEKLATEFCCSALPSQESSIVVREALATLNKAQKAALELAYFQGLTMQEIAEKTGESVANVRHHFYRGLDKLRTCLRVGPQPVRVSHKEIVRAES